jgi:hypothetical protein
VHSVVEDGKPDVDRMAEDRLMPALGKEVPRCSVCFHLEVCRSFFLFC